MIAEHDANGKILHVVNDPVPPGLSELMAGSGKLFVEFPPVDPGEGRNHVFTPCDILTDYVVEGCICKRPVHEHSITRLEDTLFRIDGIEKGSMVRVYLGDALVSSCIADGEPLDLEIDEPCKLRVYIEPEWPYQENWYEIDFE
ncbi:hypothetical protein NA8A_04130 [Nitratireductor indicus C115]|uniref:Uncharacterized protein n=1 Tax=Nitratireductor indicus C115 TaxID=1231190 RepID=K2N8Z5_9HYPH|nr:hypothetical protein [Nitratireductor indicus]EKF43968.1 hypothetical protein NA8A_04130 [Nitratireductor indicus C115]SFQ13120.1 hypothetical protein SAMN05216176_101489 [Nitratireductor indicus]